MEKIITTSIDDEPIQLEVDEYSLENSLENVKSVLEDAPDSEDQRVRTLKKLHMTAGASAWVIGELLRQQQEILNDRYQAWLNAKTPEDTKYTQERTVTTWCENRRDRLGFGERQARNYIKARQEREPEIVTDLGVKKLSIIRRAPEPVREIIKQKALDENWTAAKLTDEVKNIQARYVEEPAPIKKWYDLIFDDDKSIRVVARSRKDRDLIMNALHYYDQAIKNYLNKASR